MPSFTPSIGINTPIGIVNPSPVDGNYGPYSSPAEAISQLGLLAYVGMLVGIIDPSTGEAKVHYFKTAGELVPLGEGATGPQGETGPQGDKGDPGSAAASSLVVQYDTAGTNTFAYSHGFGVEPLVTVTDINGRLLVPGQLGLSYVDITDTTVTLAFDGTGVTGFLILGGGLTGPQGSTGPQGFTGFQGVQGPTGEVIYAGYQGFTGPQGSTGAQGFTGLQGETGPQGPQGWQGAQGHQGRTGVQGSQGYTGPQGFTGLQGFTGPQGNTGIQGYTGPQGWQGFTGPQGFSGPQGNTGIQGPIGPVGLVASMVQNVVKWKFLGTPNPVSTTGRFKSNSTSFATSVQFTFHINDVFGTDYSNWFEQLKKFYDQGNPSYLQIYDDITTSDTGVYKVSGVTDNLTYYAIDVENPSIVSNGNIVVGNTYSVTWAAQGSVGATGGSGFQGETGPQGFTGLQGVTGPQGFTGLQGVTGPQGFTGLQGVQGPTGVQGATGMNWRGTYVSSATYSVNDVVSYLGSSYIATATANSGTEPSVSFPSAQAPWNLVAQIGFKNGIVYQYNSFNSGIGPPPFSFGPPNDNVYATGSKGLVVGKVTFNSNTIPTKMYINLVDMATRYQTDYIQSWKSGDIITWNSAISPSAANFGLAIRIGTQSGIFGSSSGNLQYIEINVTKLSATNPSDFTNGALISLLHQPIGPSTINAGPIGYLPIYTQDNQSFLAATLSLPTGLSFSTSVYIQPAPTGYLSVGNPSRSYRIPALYSNPLGSGTVPAPISDFLLTNGDQDILGIKHFRYSFIDSIKMNGDGQFANTSYANILADRFAPTTPGTSSAAVVSSAVSRLLKGWINATPATFTTDLNTNRAQIQGGPNVHSILGRLIRQDSTKRTFAKTIISDEIDWNYYGKTFSGETTGNFSAEPTRMRNTSWNQIVGRHTATVIKNDIDPYKSAGFSYSTGDPDHIDNFLFNMHVSRMKSATNSTSVQTLLHHWLRGESGFSEQTSKLAFYSITQSTVLFVNPQIGGLTSPLDFATASSSIGVFTRHDVDRGYIENAYDFFASRVGNGTVDSKILNHIGYFAQSKTRGTASMDPSGRLTYNFQTTPTNWPATYSYTNTNQPWAFYAEDDKSNLGGGLMINMGATFGTQLNAWLEIQGATTSKAQIRLNPATGPSNPGVGDMWFTGDNLYFYDGYSQFDLIAEANTGQKGKLGIYPSTGTRLDDQVSWSDLGSVSVVLDPITNRDFTEETQAVGYIKFIGNAWPGSGPSVMTVQSSGLIIGTGYFSNAFTYLSDLDGLINNVNAQNHGFKAAIYSTQIGITNYGVTMSITAPYSTLGQRYGAQQNGVTISFTSNNIQGQEGGSFHDFSTPFSGGIDVSDITYTIPSNNKSQEFVMTEGGQFIKGFKRFEDQQVSFGQLTASSTSTINTRMVYGTMSQRGDIRHNIVGATTSWDNYVATRFSSATTSQTKNVKQETTWQNSLGQLMQYITKLGEPIGSPIYPSKLVFGAEYSAYIIDPRVTNNSYYAGSPIINISKWTNFVSSPGLTFGSGNYLQSLGRGFTNSGIDNPQSNANYARPGFLIGKGSSVQHHQWEDIGHQADIVNFEYTENGGWPNDPGQYNYARLGSLGDAGMNNQPTRVRSKNTVHNYFKNVINMDSPVNTSERSRFNQERHTNLFIESLGSGNPTYSFGVYFKSFGPHGKISADFFSAKPSNLYYEESSGNNLATSSNFIGYYAQDKVSVPSNITDPLGRDYDSGDTEGIYEEMSNSFLYYKPWSFFAESDKANFGGGLLLMGTNSSVVRSINPNPEYSDILKVYRTGLEAWLTIQEPLANKPQIKFLPGTPSTAGFGDGEMWYTGTALSFKSEGTIYDLLTSGGGGGAGFQGPTGPSGVNRSDTFSATTSFTVTHNFNTIPVVEVVSGIGDTFPFDVIIPTSVVHNSLNDYTVTFATTSSGRILTGIGQNGNVGGQGVKGDTGPQGPTGPSELTPIGGPTGSILVRYASGWTAFSATTSTDVYLKSNGYNLPIWATVSGGGGSGDVQTGEFLRIPIYSTNTSGTTLDDVVQSTSIQLASQTGGTKTYTIPNLPGSADFVMTSGQQTIGGTKSFSNQVVVSEIGSATVPALKFDGSGSHRWIDFGVVGSGVDGAGGPSNVSGANSVGTRLVLHSTGDSEAVSIGAKNNTGSPDSNLWMRVGSSGGVYVYRDTTTASFISSELQLGSNTIAFNSFKNQSYWTKTVTLVVDSSPTLTQDRTISLPVINGDNRIIVKEQNPGLTGSESGKAGMVLDAYGTITRGGEIVSLGVYSMATGVGNQVNGNLALSTGSIVPSGGKTIPANWWAVGKVVTGKIIGSLQKITGTTIKFELRYGSNVLATLPNSGFINLLSVAGINTYEIDFTITCRQVGASGQFRSFMKIQEYLDGGGPSHIMGSATTGSMANGLFVGWELAASVSTTTAQELDVWVITNGNTQINVDQVIVEYKN